MKRMSFYLTKKQIEARAKWVTRRLSCRVQAGERVLAVERLQGLKKGEKQKAICEIEIVSVRQEPLFRIADWDFKHPVSGIVSNNECYREGFPEMLGPDFVDMFCRHMKCQPNQWVFRIEFKYV